MLFYHMFGGWFANGRLGQGCWYLWLSSLVRFLCLRVVLSFVFCLIMARFGIHREYEDSSSDVQCNVIEIM